VRAGEQNIMLRTPLAAAVALAVSLVSNVACAQDAQTLDRVSVTGTRTAVTVDDALSAVDIIDRAEIERTQAQSLPDLLRGRAGINLVNQGGAGKLTTLFLRGSESDHVLFLIDGVRVGSSTSGLTALQDIPVELIERIEIVRGPRSSLYGSDAVGGVIQIFTRRTQQGVRPRFMVGGGTNDLRALSAGVDFGFDRAWFGADYSHQATDGFNSCTGAATPVFAGCFMDNPDPDDDGYESNAISVRGGIRPVDGLTIDAHALRNEGRNEIDADPQFGLGDVSNTTQQVLGGKARWDIGRTTLTLAGGSNIDRSVQTRDGAFTDSFESRRTSASLQADVRVADGQLATLGYDWQRDVGQSEDTFGPLVAVDGDPARRQNHAAFLQYQGAFGAHDVQAAVRRDDNEQFGGHTTGNIAWGMDLAHGFRITASAGSAFKAPTFNELYFPFFGNPDLLPEESETYELGVGQKGEAWHWDVHAFQTNVDDLIVYDSAKFMANNLEDARIRGAELTAGATIAEWTFAGAASWVDPRNRSTGDNFENILPRRARASARLDVDRAFGDFSVGATFVAEDRRFENVDNSIELAGYATFDLRAAWKFSPSWTLSARASNVFDRDYETAAYYPQAGREFGLTLRYAAQ
jgi:vitamin B12 transporter